MGFAFNCKLFNHKKPITKRSQILLKTIVNCAKDFFSWVGKPLYWLLLAAVFFILFIQKIFLYALYDFFTHPLKVKLKPKNIRLPKLLIKHKKSRRLINLTALLVLIISLIYAIFWNIILKDLPTPKSLTNREIQFSTKIYDRNGNLLYNIYKDENRTPVKLLDIPIHVQLAVLAAEDAQFYNHLGFSVKGMSRAIYKYINEGKVEGGSTITQQLVKNALLTPERTIIRKTKEIYLAIKIERIYPKKEILEMYLNEVPFGGTAYGIREAARVYFNKDVKELNLSEGALLAGLIQSPTKYSPFGANPKLSINRQKEILGLMVAHGFITNEQKQEALKHELVFAENKIDILAPHFVMFVRQALVERFGEEMVEKGGLKVITTLDLNTQKLAENAVAQEVKKLSPLNVGNGAALVVNPKNGDVLAMVGSKNYFDTQNDGNVNVLTSLRQPGSSIKVVNYAYALGHGYTPATILEDTPITYNIAGSPPYTPKNYDNTYRGRISLRSALAESRNIPAVKVLAGYGVSNMVALGQKMGIASWQDPTDYGLSLTLGGGDVRLIELAQAYATIANNGVRVNLHSIQSVTNSSGEIIYENTCGSGKNRFIIDGTENICGEKVLDPRITYILTDILSDNTARSPAFGSHSALNIPGHKVAVKTGTSNDLRDNVTIGYTPNILVATWVGNNDNSPMSRLASGITGAAPIWNKIITNLIDEKNTSWEAPSGLVQKPICPLTGTLPCSGCGIKNEWFLEENQPQSCEPRSFEDKAQGESESSVL